MQQVESQVEAGRAFASADTVLRPRGSRGAAWGVVLVLGLLDLWALANDAEIVLDVLTLRVGRVLIGILPGVDVTASEYLWTWQWGAVALALVLGALGRRTGCLTGTIRRLQWIPLLAALLTTAVAMLCS